ncbi:MAG: hypothetical protein WBX30_14665 [Stellaceae bacterium]
MRSISGERRLSLVYPALLSLGAGVLSSCGVAEGPPPAQTSAVRPLPPPPETPAVHNAAPRPARKPFPPPPASIQAPAPSGEPAEGTAAPESSSPASDLAALSPSPARQGQIPSQAELIGLDQSGAMRLLGPATEKSDEPPATVWRYKTESCELDLFFYLDLRSGSMRTLHYSFKGEGAEVARQQECWRSLIASRGG